MEEIWEFLSVPKNQEVIAWLAGGVCAAISAIWAMLVKRRATRAAESSEDDGGTGVSARRGGVAAGGDAHIGGDLTVTQVSYPRGVWTFAVAGLALIALSFVLGGARMDSSAKVEGDMTDSSIEINRTGQ